MEGKNTQNLNLNFKIPIIKYEKDMETELAREVKKEILDLFQNHNNLLSKKEFGQVEYKLHEAIKNGDLELIKIYLSQTITNSSKDQIFKIDKTNQTASLFKVNRDIEKLIIPLTVKHESKKFLITSVCGTNDHNEYKTVKFVENSAVKTFFSSSFLNSQIEEIHFPASLKELKEGWCRGADKLTKIIIPPSNNQFIFEDDKYLLGKTDNNSDEFDILLFASRGIEIVSIPSNIKIISSYAFEKCEYLRIIDIPTYSQLQTIGKYAFVSSIIEEIFIPPSVKKICTSSFSFCSNLKKVEFPPNSNLQTIEKNAFYLSQIEEIVFPASLKELKKGWCHGLFNLKKIQILAFNNQFEFEDDKYLLGKTDNNSDEFDILLFASREIEEISIPSNIKIISSYAFENCINLRKIEIPANSNLQIIESYAFAYSKIEEIYFPESLKELEEGWHHGAKKLAKIIISPSNNQFIFKDNKYLLGKTDNNSDEFDILLSANRNIEEISIPSNIKIISSYAFEKCKYLNKIDIPTNSQLQTIEEHAFSSSGIKQIFIPSKISKKIGCSLYKLKNLIKVEIPANNEKNDTFIKKELSTAPHIDVPIVFSAILSISLYDTQITVITKDYKAIEGKKIFKKGGYYNFEENPIKDENDKNLYPISGFECINYNLYMVSEVEKGIKTKLVKNGNFLNIGEFNPIAIFCGYFNCAAIDLKGEILYIPDSYNDRSSKLIESKHLPNNEKAVDIACLNDFLYVLSSKGKLYMSKNADSFNIVFQQVEQFKKINVIQISGIFNHILVLTEEGKVYSNGQNLFGELGTGDTKDRLRKFFEISSLNQYKITSVSAGENHSLFLTSNGEIFACGNNKYNQCFVDSASNNASIVFPTITRFRSGADFCISSFKSAAVCIGFDPEMSPNRRVKDEINILLFGCSKKTGILQAFVNNNFENTFDEYNNQDEEDYIVNLEIHRKVIKLRLIDVNNIDDSKECYQRAINLIYFFDNSNQLTITSSFRELNKIYKEANQVWNSDIKLVIVNCTNTNSKKIKYDENLNQYKCEIFEIDEDKNIENINKPFFSFLPKIYKNQNEILKIGKEYRNPFDNINKDNINIGLFGSKNINKTELAFRYIYGDLYKEFYEDFISNFSEDNLEQIVEINNKYYNVSILDSTFVENKDDDFGSYYSAVNGIIFVFQIELLSSSSSDFIKEINKFYQKAKDSVERELNIIIAFEVSSSNKKNELYQSLIDKIKQIEERFECEVYFFNHDNGEDIEYLFYYLIKRIIQIEKQDHSISKRKTHQKKKIKAIKKKYSNK